ncbi:hypothetical protein L7F22_011046 [Adiantum nelumboides]|nr:hypothetical protein [Adiantum nelumboides]
MAFRLMPVIFKLYDADGDGEVTQNDVLEVLQDLSGPFLSIEQRQQVVNQAFEESGYSTNSTLTVQNFLKRICRQPLCIVFCYIELRDAVHGLDGESCLGDDGLTRQFFIQQWDLISQPLQEILQHIFDTGRMPQSMSLGIISLISKGGDASSLRQWRSITLMPSVYKILARMISARLRPFLPVFIHSSQTGFVQDCSIQDNVVTYMRQLSGRDRRSSLLRLCFSI